MLPFTTPWAHAFCVEVNSDDAYRAAAAHWRMPVAMVLERIPELGYPDDIAVHLDLREGRCHGARIVRAAEVKAPLVLRGHYGVWKRIVLGELDPVAAVMKRELHVSGPIMTLMLHVSWARALLACARRIEIHDPAEVRAADPAADGERPWPEMEDRP